MSGTPCSWPRCPNTTRRGSGRCHVHRYADRGSRDRTTPAWVAADLDATVEALRAAFPGLRVEATAFVSGALELDARRGTARATLRKDPAGGWGVSIAPDDAVPHDAEPHDAVADSLEEAVALLRRGWTPCDPPTTPATSDQAGTAGRQSRHGR